MHHTRLDINACPGQVNSGKFSSGNRHLLVLKTVVMVSCPLDIHNAWGWDVWLIGWQVWGKHLIGQSIRSYASNLSTNQKQCSWPFDQQGRVVDCALECAVQWNNERSSFSLKMFLQSLKTGWLNRQFDKMKTNMMKHTASLEFPRICYDLEKRTMFCYDQQGAAQQSRQASWNNIHVPWNNLCNKLFECWHDIVLLLILLAYYLNTMSLYVTYHYWMSLALECFHITAGSHNRMVAVAISFHTLSGLWWYDDVGIPMTLQFEVLCT